MEIVISAANGGENNDMNLSVNICGKNGEGESSPVM